MAIDPADAWIVYCDRYVSPMTSQFQEITPHEALQLLLDMVPIFVDREPVLSKTSFRSAYEAEADAALGWLAQSDSLEDWKRLSPEAWRVLAERLLYALRMTKLHIRDQEPSVARLPVGLDRARRSRALFLLLLGNSARVIDWDLIPEGINGCIPLLSEAISIA
jgi:hypothetical protein